MNNDIQFIHLSDCHLGQNKNDKVRGFSTYGCLKAILRKIALDYPDIDFLLITGDISQACTVESYRLFKELLTEVDIPIYCVPGNHDVPHLLAECPVVSPTNQLNSFSMGSNTFVLLNTHIKSQNGGELPSVQLNHLNDLLNEQQKSNLFIALHHPPIDVEAAWLNDIGLKNKDDFIHTISQHKNVRAVFFGHVHHEFFQIKSNINFYSTPSTCYQFLAQTEDFAYDNAMPGFRLVKIQSNGTIFSSVVRLNHIPTDHS